MHCVPTETGFLVGLCFVKDGHQDPVDLHDVETGKVYVANIGEQPGVYSRQGITVGGHPLESDPAKVQNH